MKFDDHYEKNNLSIPIGSILNSEVKSERMKSEFVRKIYRVANFKISPLFFYWKWKDIMI